MVLGIGGAWWVLGANAPSHVTSADLEDRAPGTACAPGPLDSTPGGPGDTAQLTADGEEARHEDVESDEESGPLSGDAINRSDPGVRTPNSPPSSKPTPDSPGRNSERDTPPGALPGGGGNPGQPAAPPKPEGLPKSARDPTPREAAAARRFSKGGFKKAGIPKAAEEAEEEIPLDLTKLAEPDVWAEYWAREGYTPPAMVKTPVRGKLMSLLDNKAAGGARVRIFTFFPATSRLSGPLLPVVMEATTDDKGFFDINLPVPKSWPSNYPKFAISADAAGLRVLDAAVYDNLRAGESNEIGVFWLPEEPYELQVSASNPEPGLTVAATGRLDPRRWETRRAKQILPLFTPQPLPDAGAKLRGTWDYLKPESPPYVTLLRNGEPVLTRQCTIGQQPEVTSGPVQDPEEASQPEVGQPFDPMVFPNDGYLTLSGTVVDGDAQPIEGAVLSVTVNGEARVAYSDSTGWFSFQALPDKVLQLEANHELYAPRKLGVTPGTLDTLVELTFKRPRVTLHVVNATDEQPVTEIWLNGQELKDAYAEKQLPEEMQTRHMLAEDGMYLFECEYCVLQLFVQAPGFHPVTLGDEQIQQGGTLEVRLTPGLDLHRNPRDYDAVQNEALWHKDDGEGPGLWSLDDDHWVEYAFEFGETEVSCDLLLGVTNHTYGTLPLDNEYLFDVDVYVDGEKKGTLHIASDPEVAQIGRLNLGKLSGAHTIRLMWLNDRYIPGQLDANIRYESIRILEVP